MPCRLNRFKRSFQWPFEASLFFPNGLHGFSSIKSYALVAKEKEAPFIWLETKGSPEFAFVVIDPFLVVPQYNVYITKSDLKKVNIRNTENLFLLTIVNTKVIPFTLNLSAPILIDWNAREGQQLLIAADSSYPIDSRIF